MTAARPSDRIDGAAWGRAHDRLVASLRDLIRIPSINPPDPTGPETAVAAYLAAGLAEVGVPSEIVEPVPGRGSVVARLRGDGTGGGPLLLLSHLDVVPAPPERWTHDPFGGDVADGYVYGRGAVDMKDLVAMELEVVRLLAGEARAAGRDPATDPIPGLRRDVILASTADEEAGGIAGAKWIAEHRPELLRADGAVNESGAVSIEVGGGRRIYPIQVAEKGYVVYRVRVNGTWGHGSMPRPDNAVVLAARIVERLAEPLPPRLAPVMRRFLEGAAEATPGAAGRLLAAIAADPAAAGPELDRLCAPVHARSLRALIRDTVSPNVVRAGIKYNVIPGEATIELDCRTVPGTTEPELRAAILDHLGPELSAVCELELDVVGPAVEAPASGELYDTLEWAVRAHDRDGTPLPVMVPFGTDAKHLDAIGVPVYGFSPLRMPPEEAYLERFHGVDERVSLEALRWGLPVLYDAVRRYCG